MHDLLLQIAVEIDEQVAAGDEIDVGERRILEQVVHGKQDDVAELLAHAIMSPSRMKKRRSRSSLTSASMARGKRPPAPTASARRQIGAEHLDRRPDICVPPPPAAAWQTNRPPLRWRSPTPRRGSSRSGFLPSNSCGTAFCSERFERLAIAEKVVTEMRRSPSSACASSGVVAQRS